MCITRKKKNIYLLQLQYKILFYVVKILYSMNNNEGIICQNNLMEKISKGKQMEMSSSNIWARTAGREEASGFPSLPPFSTAGDMFKCSMTSSSFIIIEKKIFTEENPGSTVHSFVLHNSPPNRMLDERWHIFILIYVARNNWCSKDCEIAS